MSVCPCCTSLQEKIERAANYARVMRELAQLGQFVRLADYLFVEAVMATAVVNVEELLGVLTAHKQQVGRPAMAERWLQRALVVGMACRFAWQLHSICVLVQARVPAPKHSSTGFHSNVHAASAATVGGQDQGSLPGGGRV